MRRNRLILACGSSTGTRPTSRSNRAAERIRSLLSCEHSLEPRPVPRGDGRPRPLLPRIGLGRVDHRGQPGDRRLLVLWGHPPALRKRIDQDLLDRLRPFFNQPEYVVSSRPCRRPVQNTLRSRRAAWETPSSLLKYANSPVVDIRLTHPEPDLIDELGKPPVFRIVRQRAAYRGHPPTSSPNSEVRGFARRSLPLV